MEASQKQKNWDSPIFLSDHYRIKLKIHSKQNSSRCINSLRWNNSLTNDERNMVIKEESKKAITIFLELSENRNIQSPETHEGSSGSQSPHPTSQLIGCFLLGMTIAKRVLVIPVVSYPQASCWPAGVAGQSTQSCVRSMLLPAPRPSHSQHWTWSRRSCLTSLIEWCHQEWVSWL